MLVLDSLPASCGDNYETQLPCSPGSLMETNHAQNTLKEIDEKEQRTPENDQTQSQVGFG